MQQKHGYYKIEKRFLILPHKLELSDRIITYWLENVYIIRKWDGYNREWDDTNIGSKRIESIMSAYYMVNIPKDIDPFQLEKMLNSPDTKDWNLAVGILNKTWDEI